MSAVVDAPRGRWIPAAWLALVAGWLCLLVPDVAVARLIGLALAFVGLVLAAMALMRGNRRGGTAALVAALVITPLVYYASARMHGTSMGLDGMTGSSASATAGTTDGATSNADGSPRRDSPVVTAPPAPRPDIAMRTTVTAVELSGAYTGGATEGDKQFKGQRLLLAGMIDSLDPDAAGGPVVTFNAGEMPQVLALGLSRDVAASFKPGQQVILACDGAGMSGGKATVDHCKPAR